MNIFRTLPARALILAGAVPLAVLFAAGCDIESTDSTAAVVSDNSGTIYSFAGLYMNPNNTASTNGPLALVYPNTSARHPSGKAIVSLRLLQYGSVLEAYDSEGLTWAGSISDIRSGVASFSLRGRTTAGQDVDIAGTMTYADQQSTMDATWIEPDFYGSLFARATVSPATTNSASADLSLVASDYNVALSEVVTLTASGGSGSYSWPSSVSYGTFSASGASATYTRTSGTSANSVTISVSSGGDSDSVTLEFD